MNSSQQISWYWAVIKRDIQYNIQLEENILIKLNSTKLWVQSAKYLGVHINDKLSVKKHARNVIKSLLKHFNIFDEIKHAVFDKFKRQLYMSQVYQK